MKLSIVLGMGLLRIISGLIELSAAFLMLYFNRVETAFKINACLALIGPLILISVTSLGLIGLADKVSLRQIIVILCGVALIFIGLNKI
ncbi:MAG: YqhV family protein [Clostridia bacterium]|nr:YqhV family protein [Clostridia bacterium]